MKPFVPTVLLLGALALCALAAAPGPAAPPPVSRAAAPAPDGADGGDVRMLLSSVDMTVSLLDAYGQCRERPESHERCMALLRETLDHARSMLGH